MIYKIAEIQEISLIDLLFNQTWYGELLGNGYSDEKVADIIRFLNFHLCAALNHDYLFQKWLNPLTGE